MTDLENKLIFLDQQYRLGKPLISDPEFDNLFDTLPADSILRTKAIISKVSSDRMEKVKFPTYSMEKIKTFDAVKIWIRSLNLSDYDILTCSGKYDGISLSADELPMDAWTSSDNGEGQKSSSHFQNMNTGSKHTGYTYGEAIMPIALFKKHERSDDNPDGFSNPRNMVAGLFNTSEIRLALKDVYFMRYGINGDMSKSDQLISLNKSNPIPVLFSVITVKDLLEMEEDTFVSRMDYIYRSVNEVFEVDGVIIEVDDAELRKSIGRERNLNPAYARAIKLAQWQSGDTVEVEGITWEVSKQGILTPVINVKPTQIGGVTISNVTGYNARYIDENNIGPKAIIEIIRSGDVIPKHIKTVSFVSLNNMPYNCPSCGSPVNWDENLVELVCSNKKECTEVIIKKIMYFFRKAGFDNFGEGNIRDLYANGYKTIDSILNANWHSISQLPGWGSSSAGKVNVQIMKLKQNGMPVAQLMQALDLFDGKTGAKIVQAIFDTLEDSNDWYDERMLVTVPGISNKTAKVFIESLKLYTTLPIYTLVPISYWSTPKVAPKGNNWAGASVCFTGVRDAALEVEIESQGGKIASGVSKTTTLLVVKDNSDKCMSSGKCVKARELGIKILPISEVV